MNVDDFLKMSEADQQKWAETYMGAIFAQYLEARQKHPPMRGAHEGYAILLEEVDEMWDAIKKNDLQHAKIEALQVAAMALAFVAEVK